jgi:ligand-binding sensor domain-containing protein
MKCQPEDINCYLSSMKRLKVSDTLSKFDHLILTAVSRIFISFAIVLLYASVSNAQQARQYSYKHFSVINGLASNTIYDVRQDKDGYIWIATVNGLQRYDGNDFLTFKARKNDPGSIPNNSIGLLYTDKKGRLWIASDHNNVGIFDTKKFLFKKTWLPYDPAKIYPGMHFVELTTGELLLVKHGSTILRYDEQKNEFITDEYIIPHPKNWKVNEIAWDAVRKKYWLSCDSGLVQFDPATKHVNYSGHNTDNDPVIIAFDFQKVAVGVHADMDGNVFFQYWAVMAGAPTIYRYNASLKKVENISLLYQLGANVGYHEIMDFLIQRNGRVWAYGMPFFAEWIRGTATFNSLTDEGASKQNLDFDHANHAFEDRENNIWIATDNGVFMFNPDAQVFNTYNLVRPGEAVLEPPVQALAEANDGRIFVGAWGMGIFCFDNNFNPLPVPSAFKPKYSYMSIWDMAIHSKTGRLWIGEQGGILDIYDFKTNKLDILKPEAFALSTIRQIDEDTSGNMWFGTQNGRLVKWDFKKTGGDHKKGYELIYQTSRILKVHYDYQGFIWVATLGNGLIKLDARTNKVVKIFTAHGPEGERLFHDSPCDMTYYNDSTLLVAAGCLNIINTKTNKITYITADDGLPSNTTESLQRDKYGIVWIGMTNGICRLNYQKRMISYYDRRDGIAYDKFASTGVEQLQNGRMVFFTDHNFLAFNPTKIVEQNQPPKPYITSFKVAGIPISIDSLQSAKNVVLKYNNTSIGIDFSALSYLSQRKLHYYYMLEGLDEDWIHTDHPIEAIYNYLPPGDYVFKVKSENVDGVTNTEIASIPIVVRPPVWNTWWFYGLIALLVIAILYLLDRERMNKSRTVQQMRRQIGLNLHDEVSTTLNNINVLSEIAKIKADKNLEQSKDFIDQISSKSRHMIEAMDDVLWSIDPQNDSMKKTILRIKELTEGIKAAHDTDIDLIVDNKVQGLELDMKLRHEIYFYYKEAINFLVQNVYCRQVFVNINQTKSKLLIEMLSECKDSTADFKSKFKAAVQKRVNAMPSTIDILAEDKSFSAVLYVDLK